MIGLKKRNKEKERKTNVEKRETHIDNREFGCWVEISTNYYYFFNVSLFYFFESYFLCESLSLSLFWFFFF